jgi:uncharacterized membrane protein YfcA
MMILVLIGLVIGLVLGLTGAGGSVFAVPLLMFAGMPMTDAVGLSLGTVAASTLYGSARGGLQQHPILWKPGVILAVVGALTAPLGKWLGLQIDERILVIGFSVLALIIALRMWYSAQRDPVAASVVRAGDFSHITRPGLLCHLSQSGQFELRPRCVSGLLVGGVVVGLLSGLFGVGGGFLIVPLLLALSPISMAQSVSTSLMIIALVSGSGFISHLFLSEQNNGSLLGLVALGGVAGMMLGQAISHRIANALLQKLFALALLVIALVTLAQKLFLDT